MPVGKYKFKRFKMFKKFKRDKRALWFPFASD